MKTILWFLAIAMIFGWGWGFFFLAAPAIIHLLLVIGVIILGINLFKKDRSVG